MPDEVSQEVRDKLELRRSEVRRYLTYAAMVLFAILVGHGAIYMGDRAMAIMGATMCLSLINYWFGQRSTEKKNKEK